MGGIHLEEKHNDVFRQYDMKVYNMSKARSAFLLETNQGIMLYRSYEGSKNHLEYENEIKKFLLQKQYDKVDLVVENRNGELLTDGASGEKFLIKHWFSGEECNLHDTADIVKAVKNLAILHLNLVNVSIDEEKVQTYQEDSLLKVFRKHNRELKYVKSNFITKKQRNEFELCFLANYDMFYEQAIHATELLEQSNYLELRKACMERKTVCHGNYTYHNILINRDDIATTNFDKACHGMQISDLYLFIRKCMEKNNWNIEIGKMILAEYEKILPLDKEELRILFLNIYYPEKFWKITNNYFNNKKSWVNSRNIQKLNSLKEQESMKAIFLETLFS